MRIQHLRAEADALEEQLKMSVKKLAELRHELFDTSVTTFPEDSRAVPFDELLQYATNISRYTVPPTYRERIPAADKDKEDEDVGSSGAPTNGLNTPALPPETVETATEAVQGQKEGEDAAGPALEITPEEEEWLKKLKASNLAWYPWPSNEKIRAGALFSLQYWREVSRNLQIDVKHTLTSCFLFCRRAKTWTNSTYLHISKQTGTKYCRSSNSRMWLHRRWLQILQAN